MKKLKGCLLRVPTICLILLGLGSASTFAEGPNSEMSEVSIKNNNVSESATVDKKILKIPYIFQGKNAACESVSAVMALNHLGYDITYNEFIDKHLVKKDWRFETKNVNGKEVKIAHACDPYKDAFVGDPRKVSGENCGYGCFATVLEKSINSFIDNDKHLVLNTTGSELEDLVKNYLGEKIPVVIWATMEMQEPFKGNKWILEDGKEFTWMAREHCLVLVGYDSENYLVNDPRVAEDKGYGLGVIPYSKEIFRTRYNQMGKNSLVIIEKPLC